LLIFDFGHVTNMSDSYKRLAEPTSPEHQLLRNTAPTPQLSSGLRERVVVDVRRQLRYGRWADRLRISGAVLVASLMVCLVWNFRWTGQQQVVEQNPDAIKDVPAPPIPSRPLTPSSSYSNSDATPQAPVAPRLPQGGPSSRPETEEMRQFNRLIDDIQGRNNILCGLLSVW